MSLCRLKEEKRFRYKKSVMILLLSPPFLSTFADRTTQKTNLQPNESERIKRVEQQVVALTISV